MVVRSSWRITTDSTCKTLALLRDCEQGSRIQGLGDFRGLWVAELLRVSGRLTVNSLVRGDHGPWGFQLLRSIGFSVYGLC